MNSDFVTSNVNIDSTDSTDSINSINRENDRKWRNDVCVKQKRLVSDLGRVFDWLVDCVGLNSTTSSPKFSNPKTFFQLSEFVTIDISTIYIIIIIY